MAEVACQLVEPYGDAAMVLEPLEGALDQIALGIERTVDGSGSPGCETEGDYHTGATLGQGGALSRGVVALVGDHGRCRAVVSER